MRRRSRSAYQQGQLDGFCGLYCLINAVYFLGCIHSHEQACELLEAICLELESSNYSLTERVARGTDTKEIMGIVSRVLEPRFGIKRVRPFVGRRVTFEGFVERIESFLENQNGIALIHLGGCYDHWTLVSSVTQKAFRLFDSDQLKYVSLSNCQLESEYQTLLPCINRHVIDKNKTHFLWVD